MNTLPVDRALIIYGALANRSETKGVPANGFPSI
jgi:hypothetical protein